LLTLLGARRLREADLILYDGLVNPLLLRHSRALAKRTCRSEAPSGRMLKQEEINQQLIEAARSGQTVVRLKGGDPYIFGRGSEEARALRQAGIPFEVVPGVTAAIAAGDYAGISLTHRELASAVAFITGHESPDKSDSMLDFENLARFPGTRVFYMGLHRLPEIVRALIEHGVSPDIPACVISRATTPAQRTVSASLAELPAAVAAAHLRAPSLIVIGECVSQREEIAWFEKRPLFGLRIGITRPVEQAEKEIERAVELGVEPVLLPTISIGPPSDWGAVDAAISTLNVYDWIVFTSVNGVENFFERLWELGFDARRLHAVRFACIGPATADRLADYHLRADLVPEQYRAEELAKVLGEAIQGGEPAGRATRILWPRANRGRDVLPERMRALGAIIDEVVVYENNDVESFPADIQSRLREGTIDWIGLSSPSIARNFHRLLDSYSRAQLGERIRLVAISPVTSAAAAEVGLPIAAVATEYTWGGIFEAIARVEGERPSAARECSPENP